MSIAIFAILLNNTLERTHKRNTKKCLELALKCLKLAELVKNGTKLLLFTAFTTFCISLYGKTSKCRICTCWSCGVNLVLNAAGNSKSAKVAIPFSRNTIRLPDLMISWSSPSIYQNDHKIFNKHHLAAVPDGFEKKGHDHNHCCFHCHLMISSSKKHHGGQSSSRHISDYTLKSEPFGEAPVWMAFQSDWPLKCQKYQLWQKNEYNIYTHGPCP